MSDVRDQAATEIEDRRKKYGPAEAAHAAFGKVVTALIEQHYGIELDHAIPAHLAALIQVGSKIVRAAAPTPCHEDNYVDGIGYLIIAQEAEQTNEQIIDLMEETKRCGE